MPFGLDLKTMIVTAIFVLFVLPWIRATLLNRTSSQAKTAQ